MSATNNNVFEQVATVPEVCAMYYVTHHTVYYWINRGYVQAEWVGFWLISTKSLYAFRKPTRELHHLREQMSYKV